MKDRPGFEAKLMDYLKNNPVDLTISVGDITSDILSGNKEEILKYTHITSPDHVITSYSIHYTKLYDLLPPGADPA